MVTNPKIYPQFLLLGDSLIQYSSLSKDGFCFVAGLAERCERRLDIVNRGLSGYTTANELVILQDLVPSPEYAKVDYVLLLLGANDSCLPKSPSNQHIPLEEYRANMNAIINHPAIAAHKPAILLVTPPPINEVHLEQCDLKKGYTAVSRHQSFTAQYVEIVKEVAKEHEHQNVILIDLFGAMLEAATQLSPGYVAGKGLLGSRENGDNEGLRQLLVDGLHFTGAGYKVFLDAVLPHVGREWEDEPLNSPSWVFPQVFEKPHILQSLMFTSHWSIAPKI